MNVNEVLLMFKIFSYIFIYEVTSFLSCWTCKSVWSNISTLKITVGINHGKLLLHSLKGCVVIPQPVDNHIENLRGQDEGPDSRSRVVGRPLFISWLLFVGRPHGHDRLGYKSAKFAQLWLFFFAFKDGEVAAMLSEKVTSFLSCWTCKSVWSNINTSKITVGFNHGKLLQHSLKGWMVIPQLDENHVENLGGLDEGPDSRSRVAGQPLFICWPLGHYPLEYKSTKFAQWWLFFLVQKWGSCSSALWKGAWSFTDMLITTLRR